MPIACRNKLVHGKTFCVTDCPTRAENSPLEYVRVTRPEDLPPAHPRVIDVPILDMNYGWPNLGHDSIVHAVMDAGCDLIPLLHEVGLRIRAISFEVRQHRMIPDGPGERYALYLGTGGPGHIDPHLNDGGEGSQGIHEDPSWEPLLFELFNRIRQDEDAALLSVCHTFGVMCRWSGVALPVLRSEGKGGKSVGLLENVLTPEAQAHPWFSQLAEELPDHRRLRIVDHRLFDLIPQGELPDGFTALGHETLGIGGPPGDALTMLEFGRDAGGIMPRILGVNHHPEIVDRSRQLMILRQKLGRGEITEEFFVDRTRTLAETYPEDGTDQRLHLTSDFTLLGPLRFHLYRMVRLRAQALGRTVDLDERRIAEGVRT